MKDLLKMYKQLNETQKAKIFTKEQIDTLEKLVFFEKLFSDSQFYKAVEQAVAETAYEELRQA